MSSYISIGSLVRGHRSLYICALGAAALGTLCSYLPPLFLRSILDSGLGGLPWTTPELFHSVPAALTGLFLFAILGAGFSFGASFGTQKASEGMARQLRETVYSHIQRLEYQELMGAPAGDWIQRCTSDVDTLRRLASVQFPELVNSIFQASWALPILFLIHRDLAWYAVPLLPVVLIFSAVFFHQVQKAFRASDESEGRLSGILQENISGVRVVKAFARQDFERQRFARENIEFRRVTRRLINLFAVYWGAVNFLSMVQMGLVLTMGIGFVLEGKATVGTVVMFLTMTGMLVWPVRQLGRVLADMGKAKVSWGRIREILDRPVETQGGCESFDPEAGARIEFRHVSVIRDGRKLLDDLSFVIEKGQTAAILGPTGSGKSTLVKLLVGLIEYSGEIWLGQRELRTLARRELRQKVGLVLQEPWLFAKTIGENVGLAHNDVSATEIENATKTAAFHSGIVAMPDGYDTLLGERGVTLSGGQRQRTAISQMLVRPRPVLIFDDSLSAVDNHTDAQIRRALSTSSSGTVILISHRLSTLAQADRIFVLEKGRLIQQGRHEDLVLVEGLYRRMAELQSLLKEESPWTEGTQS